MTENATRPTLSQASGQYLGYAAQAVVLLLELIEAPDGSTVSLEYFGDVGVESDAGKTAIEVKSGLETNPISNRAIGLWKTLSNWINAVEAGQLQLATTAFVLHVAQPKQGPIAELFHSVTTEEEAERVLATAEAELLSNPRLPLAMDVAPYIHHVFAHRHLAQAIISRFQLRLGSGRSQTDLEKALTAKYILPELLQPVLKQILASFAPNPTPEQIEANQTSTRKRKSNEGLRRK